MWDHETIMMIVQGVGETLYMTVLSTVLGYLFGLPMGVLLAVSDKEGLKPNAVLYKILDAIANIVRSIPLILSAGFICRLTFATVPSSCSKPFAGRKCDCTGIMTSFAAVSAFIVSIPSEGVQSIST